MALIVWSIHFFEVDGERVDEIVIRGIAFHVPHASSERYSNWMRLFLSVSGKIHPKSWVQYLNLVIFPARVTHCLQTPDEVRLIDSDSDSRQRNLQSCPDCPFNRPYLAISHSPTVRLVFKKDGSDPISFHHIPINSIYPELDWIIINIISIIINIISIIIIIIIFIITVLYRERQRSQIVSTWSPANHLTVSKAIHVHINNQLVSFWDKQTFINGGWVTSLQCKRRRPWDDWSDEMTPSIRQQMKWQCGALNSLLIPCLVL